MNTRAMSENVTIGIDVGDRFSSFHVLDHQGVCLEQSQIRTTPDPRPFAIGSKTSSVLASSSRSARTQPWISRLLNELGHEVIVGNARDLRFIYGSHRKSDLVDAEALARVGRLDPKLLRPIEHRGEHAQHDLAVLHSRDALVRARTTLINHCRGVVKTVGHRLPSCSAPSFHSRCLEHVPDELKPALGPVFETIADLTRRILSFEHTIEQLCQDDYPETRVLRQITGVGALTALAYVLVLEDPRRFHKGRSVGAYLGLTPKRAQSADHDPQLRITKAGDWFLRRLLVQSAQYILGPFGPDTDLRRWGLTLAGRGGKNAKKRAVVAVARKLAVLLHHLWVRGEVYEPLHLPRHQHAA